MNDDVAGLVERLEAFRPTYGWPEEQAVVAGPTLGEEAASTIRALTEKFDAKDEECSHAWANWQEERDRVNALEAQVHEQAVEIKRLREWVAVCNVERKERDEAQAKLSEAVEFLRPIITNARYESGVVYVVRIPNDTVHQARAFLATMEGSTVHNNRHNHDKT